MTISKTQFDSLDLSSSELRRWSRVVGSVLLLVSLVCIASVPAKVIEPVVVGVPVVVASLHPFGPGSDESLQYECVDASAALAFEHDGSIALGQSVRREHLALNGLSVTKPPMGNLPRNAADASERACLVTRMFRHDLPDFIVHKPIIMSQDQEIKRH